MWEPENLALADRDFEGLDVPGMYRFDGMTDSPQVYFSAKGRDRFLHNPSTLSSRQLRSHFLAFLT